MTGHTRALAELIAGYPLDRVPADVRDETRRMFLDTVACIVAASRTEVGPLARGLGGVLGGAEAGRAYMLGRLGNALDFEEGVPSGTHFGCGAVGAALALAGRPGTTGRDLMRALVIGYETGGRISDATGPYFKKEGAAARSFADVWGATTPVVYAAAGAALALTTRDAETAAHGLGLAGSYNPVPIGAKWSGETLLPNTKYGDTGWSTLAGVFGAMAAGAGSTGLSTILDGDNGLFRMIAAPNADPGIVSAGIGTRWRVRQILYKKWPCCRWIHYPLTAFEQLLEAEAIRPDEIDAVTAEVGFAAMSARFVSREPKTFASYQFSIPHAFAMVMMGVPPGPDWLSRDLADDPRTVAARAKVSVERHPRDWTFGDFRADGETPVRLMSSGVRVTARGREYRAVTDFAFGDSYHPPMRWGDTEILAKFRALVPTGPAETIIDVAGRLEATDDLGPLLRAIDKAIGGGARALN
ncbi:MAG: MmgE/PrpD family protein [Alphaproteobacteria bacterium]